MARIMLLARRIVPSIIIHVARDLHRMIPHYNRSTLFNVVPTIRRRWLASNCSAPTERTRSTLIPDGCTTIPEAVQDCEMAAAATTTTTPMVQAGAATRSSRTRPPRRRWTATAPLRRRRSTTSTTPTAAAVLSLTTSSADRSSATWSQRRSIRQRRCDDVVSLPIRRSPRRFNRRRCRLGRFRRRRRVLPVNAARSTTRPQVRLVSSKAIRRRQG